MTTPAQPVVPAPANQPPTSAREFFQQDDAALAAAWGVQPPGADPAPVESADPTPTPALVAEGGSPERMPVAPPDEGAVELKPLDRQPMTQFSVLDSVGEVEIPDVKIKFKAKGEDRELPLDHVVRLAQFGFANEEREQQVLAARKFVSEAEQREANYQAAIQKYESSYDRIFNDPDFYEQARLNYLSQNTPEHRAARAEQELQRVRAEQTSNQEATVVNGFVQQTLVPLVQKLQQAYPHVNEHELIGRYTELTAPLLVNGRIPVNRLPHVQRLVQDDLAQWTEQRHVERDIEKRGQADKQARDAAASAAQVAATKRQASRLFAHQGSPSGDLGAPAKPVKFNSAKDWLNSTFATPTE